ncbi:MAG: hypothetical protein LBV76_00445, partial [Deltaproteobacteria bacterium]|nr:hypothetical protein [Deltaproteobacteria bacterium]
MTIASSWHTGFGAIDPKAYGLPDEHELSALLAGYFPDDYAHTESSSYAPKVVSEGSRLPNVLPGTSPDALPKISPEAQPSEADFASGRSAEGNPGGASSYVGNIPVQTIRADF